MSNKHINEAGLKMRTRKRPGTQRRIDDLKKQVDELRLKFAVLETIHSIEIIRRNNLIEDILKLNSMHDLKNLIKTLKK